jgi:hypothetical protein
MGAAIHMVTGRDGGGMLRRRTRRVVGGCALASASVAVLAVAGLGPARPSNALATDASAAEDSRVQAIGRAAAHASGDDAPSQLRWVRTTRGAAELLTAGANVGADEKQDVYVIQMHGHFQAKYARIPTGAKIPVGTVLTITFDATTGFVTDYGLTDADTDLEPLGPVHADS